MAITLRGSAPISSFANNGGNVTVNLSGLSLQENDIVIACVTAPFGNGGATPAMVSAGWTQCITPFVGGASGRPSMGVWWKRMGATPDSSVVMSGDTGNQTDTTGIVIALQGAVLSGSALDQTSVISAETSSATPDPSSIVTQTNGAWVIVFCGKATNIDSPTATPSGYSNTLNQAGSDTLSHNQAIATKEIATAGTEDPGAWTYAAASYWRAITIAIKPQTGPTQVSLNQATETDSAQNITPVKKVALAQTTETDLAQAITVGSSLYTIDLLQASETDSALSITPTKRIKLSSSNIARVQYKYQYPAGSGVGYSFPSNNTAGNAILFVVSHGGTGACSVSDSQGNTYVYLGNWSISSGEMELFYALNIKDGANDIAVTFTGWSDVGFIAVEYSGIDTKGAFDNIANIYNVAEEYFLESDSMTVKNGSLVFFAWASELAADNPGTVTPGQGIDSIIHVDVTHYDIQAEALSAIEGTNKYKVQVSNLTGRSQIVTAVFKPALLCTETDEALSITPRKRAYVGGIGSDLLGGNWKIQTWWTAFDTGYFTTDGDTQIRFINDSVDTWVNCSKESFWSVNSNTYLIKIRIVGVTGAYPSIFSPGYDGWFGYYFDSTGLYFKDKPFKVKDLGDGWWEITYWGFKDTVSDPFMLWLIRRGSNTGIIKDYFIHTVVPAPETTETALSITPVKKVNLNLTVVDSYDATRNDDTNISLFENCQSFTNTYKSKLSRIKLSLYRVGNPGGNVFVEVYAHQGTYGTTSIKSGSALCISDLIPSDQIKSGSSQDYWFHFTGANQIILDANTYYVLRVKCSAGDAVDYIFSQASSSAGHDGNVSVNITPYTLIDMIFEVDADVIVEEIDSVFDITPTVSGTTQVTLGQATETDSVQSIIPVKKKRLGRFDGAVGSINDKTSTNYESGQSFEITKRTLVSRIRVSINKINFADTLTGNIRIELYAHSGEYGNTSMPTGTALAVSEWVERNSIEYTADPWNTFLWQDFVFLNGYILEPNYYCLQLKQTFTSGLEVAGHTPSIHSGNLFTNTNPFNAYDTLFEIFEEQVYEADSALSITPIKKVTLGQATETETALDISFAGTTQIALGQTAETDLAFNIIPSLQIATETDSVQSITPVKIKSLEQASELDTAQNISIIKHVTLGQTTETDLAQGISLGGKQVTFGQVTETDLAQTFSKIKYGSLSQASEVDLARTIAPVKKIALGQAIETNSTFSLVPKKYKSLGQITETDSALSINALGKIGQATETDLAQIITPVKKIVIIQIIETDSAFTIIPIKKKELTQVIEIDSSLSLTVIRKIYITQVEETDSVPGLISVLKKYNISMATETDMAQSILLSGAAKLFKSLISTDGLKETEGTVSGIKKYSASGDVTSPSASSTFNR